MPNFLLSSPSKRALIVMMTNCFLSQDISIFHVHLRWFSFVVYYIFQMYLQEIWNNLQNNCHLLECLTGNFCINQIILDEINPTVFPSGKMFKTSFGSAFWRDLIMDPSASVNFPLIDNPRDSPFDDLRDFPKWPTQDLALVDIPVTICYTFENKSCYYITIIR